MKTIEININNSKDINNFYNKINVYKLIHMNNILKLNINCKLNKFTKKELEDVVHAFNIKDSYERLKYVYERLCDYLDDDYKKHNYCKFDSNGTCINTRVNKIKTQCCRQCKYISKKGCTTKGLACKMFFCKYIKETKKVPNYHKYRLYKYFFNINQKIISTINFWENEDEQLNDIYHANLLTYLFKK